MELLNATKMRAGYTMGMRPDGRELLVVVVKGTFLIPEDPDQEPQLAPEQMLIRLWTFPAILLQVRNLFPSQVCATATPKCGL